MWFLLILSLIHLPQEGGYGMKKVNVENLVPGMVLAKDVYNYNDQLLLSTGLCLNDKAITKLTFYSINHVWVQEDSSPEETASPTVETSYAERVQSSPDFKEFQKKFESSVAKLSIQISDIVEKNSPIDVNSMVVDALGLLNQEHDFNLFDMIHNMRQYDDLTFAHSLNVGLICHVFAGWLQMSEEEANLALACGLLHDIGKLKIPENIIKKPEKLTNTEYGLIKTHPIEGYKILQNYNVNSHIKNAALMHHERYDGSGYPIGLVGRDIDKFARIVSIADVYEAMTAARIYRGSLCPIQVISIFENEGLQKYDTKMIMTFLENIVNTYMLNRVRLNNGKIGEIIFINKHFLSRPVIKCGAEYIDLSTNPELYIEEII